MAAEKKAATPTEYLVLKHVHETGWDTVQSVKASSAPGAIRACVSKLAQADQAGTFVAVPARSWKPIAVKPKTTVQLELTEVKP